MLNINRIDLWQFADFWIEHLGHVPLSHVPEVTVAGCEDVMMILKPGFAAA